MARVMITFEDVGGAIDLRYRAEPDIPHDEAEHSPAQKVAVRAMIHAAELVGSAPLYKPEHEPGLNGKYHGPHPKQGPHDPPGWGWWDWLKKWLS